MSDEAEVGSEVFLGGGFDEDVGAETVGDVEDALFDGGGIGGGVDDAIGAEEAAEGGSGGGATGDGDGVGAGMEGELDCGEPDASAGASDEDGLLGFEGGVVEEGDCGGGVGDAEGGAGFEGSVFGKGEELGRFAKGVFCVGSGDTSCEVDTITDLAMGGWGTDGGDGTGTVVSGCVWQGWERGVGTASDVGIDGVDAGVTDLDEDLVGGRGWG